MTVFDFLNDTTEQTATRFVCFIGKSMQRFDLAITFTSHFYGKLLVTDIQKGITAVIGPDDLDEPGYLEHVYRLGEKEGQDLREFLATVVGVVQFPDT